MKPYRTFFDHLHQRGQSLVEFSLVLPMLLFVSLGIFDFGRALFTYSQASSSLREALRFGAITGFDPADPQYLDCTEIMDIASEIYFARTPPVVEVRYLNAYNDAGEPDPSGTNPPSAITVDADAVCDTTGDAEAADVHNGDLMEITVSTEVELISPFFPAILPITLRGQRTLTRSIGLEVADDPFCGDGSCAQFTDETYLNCEVDCDPDPALCGDLFCDRDWEDNVDCPADCSTTDDVCTLSELDDSPANAACEFAVCPNAICENGENALNCADCVGSCNGNLVCDVGETDANCTAEGFPNVCSPTCTGTDGVCEPDSFSTCPTDCLCLAPEDGGTGACDPGETGACDDCLATCGDGACIITDGETTGNCPADCPCDEDAICETGENTSNCREDCPVCGDLECTALEWDSADPKYCPGDCFCDNGSCEPNETDTSCAADCDPCGNGVCGENESNYCPADCVCGDGFCDTVGGETSANCFQDCGVDDAFCPNASCEPEAGEDSNTCGADCVLTNIPAVKNLKWAKKKAYCMASIGTRNLTRPALKWKRLKVKGIKITGYQVWATVSSTGVWSLQTTLLGDRTIKCSRGSSPECVDDDWWSTVPVGARVIYHVRAFYDDPVDGRTFGPFSNIVANICK